MNIVLTGNTTFKLVNFRKGLIRKLIEDGHELTILAPRDDYVETILEMGCNFLPLSLDRNGTSLVKEAKLLASFFHIFRDINPDLVFSFTIKNNIYSGLICRILNIPFAPNVTGLGPAFNNSGFLNIVVQGLYRLSFSKAYTVFFQNQEDLAVFRKAELVADDKAMLLPGSGVDLGQFAESPLLGDREEVLFLLVARMLWDKGIGVFAEAAKIVRAQFPYARFQLLGPLDPDSKSAVSREEINAWEGDGTIEYLGATRDVLPFLKNADCIVLPSFYREGTPRALIEGAAIGRPLITTDMPGCRDLIDEGRNGQLVRPRDARDLAAACKSFLALGFEERRSMGRASRALVAHRYDERFVIAAYKNIVDQVAANKPQ